MEALLYSAFPCYLSTQSALQKAFFFFKSDDLQRFLSNIHIHSYSDGGTGEKLGVNIFPKTINCMPNIWQAG